MEVILREDVSNLGNRGDVVKVADGYGRNFLLPKNLAMEATPANKAVIEQMKAAAVRRSAKEKAEAGAAGNAAEYRGAGLRAQGWRRRPPVRFSDFVGHRAGTGSERLHHRSAQGAAGRAAEVDRGVSRSCEAAPRSDGAHQRDGEGRRSGWRSRPERALPVRRCGTTRVG